MPRPASKAVYEEVIMPIIDRYIGLPVEERLLAAATRDIIGRAKQRGLDHHICAVRFDRHDIEVRLHDPDALVPWIGDGVTWTTGGAS